MATQWKILSDLRVSGVPRLVDCRANGITAVVGVETKPTPEDVVAGVHWHCWTPMSDGKKVPENLDLVVGTVIDLLDVGHRVLVHCHAGRNRSALVAACVVRRQMQIDGLAALEWVRSCRPRAIANPAFEAYLTQLP